MVPVILNFEICSLMRLFFITVLGSYLISLESKDGVQSAQALASNAHSPDQR